MARKFYEGEVVEIKYANGTYRGTVRGFYGDGLPRVVNEAGVPYLLPDYVMQDPSRIALLKASPERQKVEDYFNRRSFISRLCYLFTGKMP